MVAAPATHPCMGRCGRTDTRLYPGGWYCPDHTPARRGGRPEPDSARYCAPGRCYCQDPDCPATRGLPTPAAETIVDTRAVASGKRRAPLGRYRDAQAAAARGASP